MTIFTGMAGNAVTTSKYSHHHPHVRLIHVVKCNHHNEYKHQVKDISTLTLKYAIFTRESYTPIGIKNARIKILLVHMLQRGS